MFGLFRNKWKERALAAEDDMRRAKQGMEKWRDTAMAISGRNAPLRKALRAIADQETPKANATVKRMARMAREALALGGAASEPKVDARAIIQTWIRELENE